MRSKLYMLYLRSRLIFHTILIACTLTSVVLLDYYYPIEMLQIGIISTITLVSYKLAFKMLD